MMVLASAARCLIQACKRGEKSVREEETKSVQRWDLSTNNARGKNADDH